MDVQCERCKAEYEFDDALISGRGTTVKCTSCGYQFKIRKPNDSSAASPDRWAVRTTEGRELVFTSLRELQRAIHARQVGRAGLADARAGVPRALGAIAELEPFFDEAAHEVGHDAHEAAPPRGHESGSGPKPMPDGKRALMGSAAVAQVPKRSSRPPAPLGGRTVPTLRPMLTPTPPPATANLSPSSPSVSPMRPRIDTIRPPASANAAVPPPLQPTRPRVPTDPGLPHAGAAVSVAPVFTTVELVPEVRGSRSDGAGRTSTERRAAGHAGAERRARSRSRPPRPKDTRSRAPTAPAAARRDRHERPSSAPSDVEFALRRTPPSADDLRRATGGSALRPPFLSESPSIVERSHRSRTSPTTISRSAGKAAPPWWGGSSRSSSLAGAVGLLGLSAWPSRTSTRGRRRARPRLSSTRARR